MAKYIPEKHYVAWRNFAEKMPLAFMTVYGTDKAALKRMETVDTWVSQRSKLLPVKNTIVNEAQTGFEIANEVRRWTTSNVLWRINDPRGFQLEISSGNMAYLLGFCDISKGIIKEELIWVRDGKDNYLLPTASEEYATYTRNSTAMVSKTKIGEVNVGDHISVATGESGTYLGMYSCVELCNGYGREIIRLKRFHILRNETDPKNHIYVIKTSWKGITINERGAHENKDYSDDLNKHASDIIGPMSVDYVCMGKFDIKAALKTVEVEAAQRADAFYVNYKDVIHYVTMYNNHTSNEGAMYPTSFDLVVNKVVTNYDLHRYIIKSATTADIFSFSKSKPVELKEIKDLERFIYTKEVGGKRLPLRA